MPIAQVPGRYQGDLRASIGGLMPLSVPNLSGFARNFTTDTIPILERGVPVDALKITPVDKFIQNLNYHREHLRRIFDYLKGIQQESPISDAQYYDLIRKIGSGLQ